MANTFDFYRGDTVIEEWQLLGADAEPVENLEALTVFITVRTNPTDRDGSVVLALESGEGITVIDADTATVRVIVEAEQSATIRPGSYVYDVQTVEAGGRVTTLETGTTTVTRDSTRATDVGEGEPGGSVTTGEVITQNITLNRGDDRTLEWSDDALPDLAGMSVTFVVYKTGGLDVLSKATTVDADARLISVALSHDETAGLTASSYRYALIATYTVEDVEVVETLIRGSLVSRGRGQ